ncbi:hypothetical protein B4U80_09003 [Leptotrombidium deliense]|uniref:Uncharacterized protein n=1 Tax=Leptotrombidium deliense TaxID=299467 RepID=A0A443SJ46_9ACAR|nr:hypothetical protein B4U80_09003 [Leptotrombidium deliense]
MDELSVVKSKLFSALGDNFKGYLRLLKKWFKCNLTKEEFDSEAKQLLSPQTVTLHNQFLVSLFNKCQQLSTIGQKKTATDIKTDKDEKKVKTKKAKTVKTTFEHRFVPADISEYTQQPNKRRKTEDSQIPTVIKLTFCTGEGTLPDHFMANLRILVGVWELELDGVHDEAVALLNIAVRDFMKNILTAVLSFKSSYRRRSNGPFKHAIGMPPLNPYLKNTSYLVKYPQYSHSTFTDESGEHVPMIPPTTDFAEHEAMAQIACSYRKKQSHNEDDNKITLWHLFHALRINKSVIPSHSVYAINIERIITRLWREDNCEV